MRSDLYTGRRKESHLTGIVMVICPECSIPTDISKYEEHFLYCSGRPEGRFCYFCEGKLALHDEVCPHCLEGLTQKFEDDYPGN